MREHLLKFLLRAVLAAPLFVFGLILLFRAGGGMMGGAAAGLFGCALIVLGAIVVGGPLARVLAEPAGSLFYPSEHFREAPPLYSIAESKVKKGLYEEAMQDYERIAAKYPQEVKPYVDMLEVALLHLHDAARGDLILHRGLTVLKTEESREVVRRQFQTVHARMRTREERAEPTRVIQRHADRKET